MPILFFLFLALPAAELWFMIEVGSHMGGLKTVLLVILTAVVGISLIRHQGFATLFRFNQRLEQGQVPVLEMLEGMMLAIAGVMLVVPGFITDALGFLCLIPLLRTYLAKWIVRRGLFALNSSARHGHQARPDEHRAGSHTIEGEYHREDDKD